MSLYFYILWVILGIGLAIVFIKTQQWSVSLINPQFPKFSRRIIIGGAIVRWFIIAILLLISLNQSLISMLILFFTFMLARIAILFRLKRQYA
jgi:hypothetical protein